MSKHFLKYLGVLLLSIHSTNAQTEVEEPTIDISFRLLYWMEANSSFSATDDNNGEKRKRILMPIVRLSYYNQQNLIKLSARPSKRTTEYRYQGPPTLNFYDKLPSKTETELPTPVASVTIPEGMQDVLLILTLGGDPESPTYQLTPLDVSDISIPKNHLRISNYSRNEVAVKINKDPRLIAPKKSDLFRYDSDGNQQLALHFAAPEQENWKLFYSSSIPARIDGRVLVLLYPSKIYKNKLQVKIINI